MVRDEISAFVKKASGSNEVHIEAPVNNQFGDYSSNVAMETASWVKGREGKKVKGKHSREIANEIVEKLEKDKSLTNKVSRIEVAGQGFINFWLSKRFLLAELDKTIKEAGKYGSANIGKGKNVLVEYSSPNIAKYFGIGHLRSTIIGQALYNLYDFLGYKTIGDNHIGDWGTQFGVILAEIRNTQYEIRNLSINDLERMYVDFHKKAEVDPKLWEEAREWFKKLEEGDKNAREIWNYVRKLSLTEFDRIYKILGVKIDNAFGESFYEDKMQEVVVEVRHKGLSKKSEGAEIVEFSPPAGGMPPAMLLKTDGTTTYYTRDLATIKYRIENFKPILILYEVGSEQSLHFKQVFKTAEMLGWLNGTKIVHVAHGLIRLPQGKMSTRFGQSVRLESILNEAVQRARKIIDKSKTPRLVRLRSPSSIRSGQAGRGLSEDERGEVARAVGIGAIKYFDLMHHPSSDIIFNWEKMFVLEGNSAPYLQYTVARTQSVLAKLISQNSELKTKTKNLKTNKSLKDISYRFDISDLTFELNDEEVSLLRSFIHFPEVIEDAARNYSPNLLCNYLFSLAQKFNNFYNKHRILEKGDSEHTQDFRLALTSATGHILKNGLTLLGIETPGKM